MLGANVANASEPDWKALERSPLQVVGLATCLVKFDVYSYSVDSDEGSIFSKHVLNTYIGDVAEAWKTLNDKFPNVIVDNFDSQDWFITLMTNAAKKELENGTAWAQSLSCYKKMKGYNLTVR